MTFGDKLRALRKSKRMTQKELSQTLGLTSRTLINYEQGICMPKKADVLLRISNLFGVPVDALLHDDTPIAGITDQPPADVRRFLEEASALFAGGKLGDEDRELVMRAIRELYEESRGCVWGEGKA